MSHINLAGDWWKDSQKGMADSATEYFSLPGSIIRGVKKAAHVAVDMPEKMLSTVDKTAAGAVKAIGDTGKAVGNALPMLGLVAAAAGLGYYFFVVKKGKK